jgi:hypothetical protein
MTLNKNHALFTALFPDEMNPWSDEYDGTISSQIVITLSCSFLYTTMFITLLGFAGRFLDVIGLHEISTVVTSYFADLVPAILVFGTITMAVYFINGVTSIVTYIHEIRKLNKEKEELERNHDLLLLQQIGRAHV